MKKAVIFIISFLILFLAPCLLLLGIAESGLPILALHYRALESSDLYSFTQGLIFLGLAVIMLLGLRFKTKESK